MIHCIGIMPEERLSVTEGISRYSHFTSFIPMASPADNVQPIFLDKPKLLSSIDTSLNEEEDSSLPCLPTGLATDRLGNIYVVDNHHQTLKRFSKDGRPLSAIKLQDPWDVTVLRNGSICVTELGDKCVKVIRPQGQHTTTIGQGLLQEPRGVAENVHGELLVCDTKHECILVFKPHIMDCLGMIACNATCRYSLVKSLPTRNCPWYMGVNPMNDNIVCTSRSGHSLLSPKGRELLHFPDTGHSGSGHSHGQLSHSPGICVDSFGHVIMADHASDRVVILSSDGQSNLGCVSVTTPVAVTTDHTGHLLVAREDGWIDTYQYLH